MTDENDEIDENGIRQRWEQVGSKQDERRRRLWAASEVQAAGHGWCTRQRCQVELSTLAAAALRPS